MHNSVTIMLAAVCIEDAYSHQHYSLVIIMVRLDFLYKKRGTLKDLNELYDGLHDVHHVPGLDLGHVLGDVEGEEVPVLGHAGHDVGELEVHRVVADIEPGHTADAWKLSLKNKI